MAIRNCSRLNTHFPNEGMAATWGEQHETGNNPHTRVAESECHKKEDIKVAGEIQVPVYHSFWNVSRRLGFLQELAHCPCYPQVRYLLLQGPTCDARLVRTNPQGPSLRSIIGLPIVENPPTPTSWACSSKRSRLVQVNYGRLFSQPIHFTIAQVRLLIDLMSDTNISEELTQTTSELAFGIDLLLRREITGFVLYTIFIYSKSISY